MCWKPNIQLTLFFVVDTYFQHILLYVLTKYNQLQVLISIRITIIYSVAKSRMANTFPLYFKWGSYKFSNQRIYSSKTFADWRRLWKGIPLTVHALKIEKRKIKNSTITLLPRGCSWSEWMWTLLQRLLWVIKLSLHFHYFVMIRSKIRISSLERQLY